MVSLFQATTTLSTLLLFGSLLVDDVDSANPCFVSDVELRLGVDRYFSQNCPSDPDCEYGKEYGWPMNAWCVSKIQDMAALFKGTPIVNEDVADWDTSRVTDMSSMFQGAYSFDGDLSRWDTSNVGNFNGMFENATSFDGDLSDWNVARATNMQWMFSRARSFNSDLRRWDTSRVTSMWRMFDRAEKFNGNVSNWSTGRVTSMAQMFMGARAFDRDLCAWGFDFPYDREESSKDIFVGSGCRYQDTPREDEWGPFCALRDCSESSSEVVAQMMANKGVVTGGATAAGVAVASVAIFWHMF